MNRRHNIRNRMNGCMVESRIGGNEPSEYAVLDREDRVELFTFKTLEGARAGAKVLHGLYQLGETIDTEEFRSFLSTVDDFAGQQFEVARQREIRADLDAKAYDPAAEVKEPKQESKLELPIQEAPKVEVPKVEAPKVEPPNAEPPGNTLEVVTPEPAKPGEETILPPPEI